MTTRRTPVPRRARKGSGTMTLDDVARLAKVSAITVSRALNNPDQLSPETLQRVQRAVERTGYVPNRLAGGLASARSRLVFAIVPTIAGLVFLETVQALTDALTAEGYEVVLGQSGYDGAREDDLLDAIIGRRPDGVILTGVMHSPHGRKRLAAAGIPIVETWDLTPTPIDMLVGFSHEKVGAAAAEYLVSRGARNPAIISADDYRAGLRREGFTRQCEKLLGVVPPARLVKAPTTLGRGRRGLAALLERWPDIDAVFCSSDVLAWGALVEAQARGLEVPGRLKVFGFGDLDFAAELHPALSTFRVDGTAIGRQAARFVVDRAEGRPIAQRIVDLGFTLMARDSA
ncbi:GntR family transcriptional regulator [Betaproteobacteria bacterium GR16-43]|nr:GntR family transcriptional regulator [Betaproteobacteria bacterium GR16-43]